MLSRTLLLELQQVLLDAGLDDVSIAPVCAVSESLDPVIAESEQVDSWEYELRCYGPGFLDKAYVKSTKVGVKIHWTLHDKVTWADADRLKVMLECCEPLCYVVRRLNKDTGH